MDMSVFDGNYITGDVDQAYLDHIHQLRNDDNKQVMESAVGSGDNAVI